MTSIGPWRTCHQSWSATPGRRASLLASAALWRALRQLGLERFGTNGDRFDPTVHEAVAYEERPDATEQLVLNVLGLSGERALITPRSGCCRWATEPI